MDWRPLLGFGVEDSGTPWERACARAVLEHGISEFNEAGKRGERW